MRLPWRITGGETPDANAYESTSELSSIGYALTALSKLGHITLRNGWHDTALQWTCDIDIQRNSTKVSVSTDYFDTPEEAVSNLQRKLVELRIV